MILLLCPVLAQAQPGSLPDQMLVGYWHNWMGFPNTLRLRDVPEAYDIVDVAFAVPATWGGADMHFRPDPGIYPDDQDFKADVALLHQRGQKVLISIGGASAPIQLFTPDDVLTFVTSMHEVITEYGFVGLDIDLEGQSLFLDAGDLDFRNPTSPRIANFIAAMHQLLEMLPEGFLLTAAPETALVQGGYGGYGGIYGAYLPVLHALRESLTCVHVQHYNTGTMYGRDGEIYTPGTADFHVAMADMLLAGFTVYGGQYFEPLRPDQVAIGLPATVDAAGSGYTDPQTVLQALDYILQGVPFGGDYQLAQAGGYPTYRGLMTWSINWDVAGGSHFAGIYRPYLDAVNQASGAVPPAGAGVMLHPNRPNPFNPATSIAYELSREGHVRLEVFDLAGRRVAVLVDRRQQAGAHQVLFQPRNLASGNYVCRLQAGSDSTSRVMTLVK